MKLSNLLFEDAELDREFRKKARKIYEDLLSYLEDEGENISFQQGIGLSVSLDEFTDPVREKNPLKVVWLPSKSRFGDASYFKKGSGVMRSPYLALRGLDKSDLNLPPDERKEKLIRDLKSNSDVFIHELIHYFDDLRSDKDLQNVLSFDKSDYDTEDYYSDPVEVNAFFQAAVSELEDFIEEEGHFKFMMETCWKEDFKKFNEWMFENVIPDELEENISKDQKKRLVNRLYGFWEQLEERHEKLKNNET